MTTIMVSGVVWSDATPHVRVRRDGGQSVLEPLVDFEANYMANHDTPRMCLGHKPFRDPKAGWQDCDNVPLHDGKLCDRCAAHDATFASQLHHAHNKAAGELDAAMVRHLNQPNEMYLAAFDDGSIKVGTSTKHRIDTRLLEQGAAQARIVAASTNGVAIRELEDRTSLALGLPQSVSVKRKLDGVVQPTDRVAVAEQLIEHATFVESTLARLNDPRLSSLDRTWERTMVSRGMVHRYPGSLAVGAHDFVALDAVGKVLLFERPGGADVFAADLSKLFGLELELGSHKPDEVTVQDALF